MTHKELAREVSIPKNTIKEFKRMASNLRPQTQGSNRA